MKQKEEKKHLQQTHTYSGSSGTRKKTMQKTKQKKIEKNETKNDEKNSNQ